MLMYSTTWQGRREMWLVSKWQLKHHWVFRQMSCEVGDPGKDHHPPNCVTSQLTGPGCDTLTGDNDGGWGGCDHNILMRVSKTVTSFWPQFAAWQWWCDSVARAQFIIPAPAVMKLHSLNFMRRHFSSITPDRSHTARCPGPGREDFRCFCCC